MTIKGVIGKKCLVLVYGPSGDGKTFWTIDAVSHVASGQEYRNHRVCPSLVVYIAAEAGKSVERRFYAWREHHLSATREERSPLSVITRGANLLDKLDVEALVLELREISKEIGLDVGVIVFDTLSRSTPGGNENSPEDMTLAVGVADRLRDELGATVIFVHHSGKDAARGARGHSSLFAAADTVISVVERVATIEKSRDGAVGETFPFGLDVIELGQDADGDKVTTCVVKHTELATAKPKAPKLSPDEQIALDALREELGATGETLPGTSVLPARTRSVRVEKWRDRFYARLGGSRDLEQNAKRQAWHRGRTGLVAKHIAGCWEDFGWLI
jgi:KaiC/GvpD/RAD55 family RecA-like ATPase